MLELVRLDAAGLAETTFLQHAPVIPVSSKSGEGLDELKRELAAAGTRVTGRSDDTVTFMPIDRSFTVKGFGAVVTGTLASGEIREGAELDLMPAGRRVRVRGVQTHGRKIGEAHSGQRTAVNLAGIDHSEIERGMTLAAPGVLRTTQIFDAEIEMLASAPHPLRSRRRVRVHIGTAEVLGRVRVLTESGELAAGSRGPVQFSTESPVTAVIGQRFIVRSYSPQTTIAGGAVLMPIAVKHRGRDLEAVRGVLAALKNAGTDKAAVLRTLVEAAGEGGIGISDIRAQTGWREEVIRQVIDVCCSAGDAVKAGGYLIASSFFDAHVERTLAAAKQFHEREPLAAGLARELLREREFRFLPNDIFEAVVAKAAADGGIVAEKETIRLTGHSTEMTADEEAVSSRLRELYADSGFEPPKLEDALGHARAATPLSPAEARKVFQLLVKSGELVKVTAEYYFADRSLEKLKEAIRAYAATTEDRLIDVAKFKEIAGVSRKYAIPLLEHFDRTRVTMRAGDKRVVLK
jgi:selenocysteine-specific elongation factor